MLVYFLIQLFGLIHTEEMKKGTRLITRLIPFIILPMVILSERMSKKNIHLLLNLGKLWLILVFLYFVGFQYFSEGRNLGTTVHFAFRVTGQSHHYISQRFATGPEAGSKVAVATLSCVCPRTNC